MFLEKNRSPRVLTKSRLFTRGPSPISADETGLVSIQFHIQLALLHAQPNSGWMVDPIPVKSQKAPCMYGLNSIWIKILTILGHIWGSEACVCNYSKYT